jgi:hypothetical protein
MLNELQILTYTCTTGWWWFCCTSQAPKQVGVSYLLLPAQHRLLNSERISCPHNSIPSSLKPLFNYVLSTYQFETHLNPFPYFSVLTFDPSLSNHTPTITMAEDGEEESGIIDIDEIQAHGIGAADIIKLRNNGFHTAAVSLM